MRVRTYKEVYLASGKPRPPESDEIAGEREKRAEEERIKLRSGKGTEKSGEYTKGA